MCLTFECFKWNSLTLIHFRTIDLIFYTQSINHWDSSFTMVAHFWNEKINQISSRITIHVSVIFFQFFNVFFSDPTKVLIQFQTTNINFMPWTAIKHSILSGSPWWSRTWFFLLFLFSFLSLTFFFLL